MEFVGEKKLQWFGYVCVCVCVCVCACVCACVCVRARARTRVRTRMKKTFLRMCKGVCFSSRV